MDQADTLRIMFSREHCIKRVRGYHAKIREAVSKGNVQDVSQLLAMLEVAQQQLESTYD